MIIFILSLARIVLLIRFVVSLIIRAVVIRILVFLFMSRVWIGMSLRCWIHLTLSLALILLWRWMVVVFVIIMTSKLIISVLIKEVAIWVKETTILIDEETLLIVLAFLITIRVTSICLGERTSASLWCNASSNLSNAWLLFCGTLHFLLSRGLIPVSFFNLNLFSKMSRLLASIDLLRVLSVLGCFIGVSIIGVLRLIVVILNDADCVHIGTCLKSILGGSRRWTSCILSVLSRSLDIVVYWLAIRWLLIRQW